MNAISATIVAGWNALRPDRKIAPGRARPRHVSSSLFDFYRFETDGGPVGAKVMRREDMARSEQRGLEILRATGARVPEVFGVHTADDLALLYMEFIESGSSDRSKNRRGESLLESLAKLYAARREWYGLDHDNFIGSLPQANRTFDTFAEFWWETRIRSQMDAALKRRLLSDAHRTRAERIVTRLCDTWRLDRPGPRLVHGDLWSGNLLAGQDGTYLIDPSIGASHPEQDFAMLQLFGAPLSTGELDRFGQTLGLDGGLEDRILFWQLYPLLVHVNIFGAGYVSGVERVLARYE